MRLAAVLLAVVLSAWTHLPGSAAAGWKVGATAGSFATDLSGHAVRQLAPPGTRAVVLFFTGSDCPISNRYVPVVTHLDADGAQPYGKSESKSGVVLWWVYPNPSDTAEVVRAHRARYDISGHALLDTRHTLVRMTRATVTPEAAVLVPDARAVGGWRLVYHGRIDDRYAALGRERPQATHHDLADALSAALAGRSVPGPGGPPVGCAIVPLAE